MSLLDTLIYGYRTVYSAAVEITRRNKINFAGGLSAVDNPTTGMTDVTASMSAADKTKLDAMQPQGASVAIAALEIDWSLGSLYTKTLAAGLNTFTFANDEDGEVISVELTGATSTVAWPGGIRWQGGAAPTQSSTGVTCYTFAKTSTGINGTGFDVS